MKKLTILTDLDDVLWDLCGLWINELNIRYGTSVRPRDVTDWVNRILYHEQLSICRNRA